MTSDPKRLAQQRFDTADFEPPDARHVVYTSTDVPAIVETLVDAVRPVAQPGARIIELGFGQGDVLAEMSDRFPDCHLSGLDLSERYLRQAIARFGSSVGLTRGDMERLPFRGASFDAVVTCWTLYFMRDLDAALAECRRALRVGGVFVAATNARDHMHEYASLARQAVGKALGRDLPPDIDIRFDINSGGDAVRRHFPRAQLREWHGTLTLTTLDAVETLWTTYGDWSVTDGELPAVRGVLRRVASEVLARDGAIRITRHGGAFVAHA